MSTLNTDPNIPKPDDFYARLLAVHEGRTKAESDALNARLILILSNHIGDPEVLVADPGDSFQYYPMFSPDSKWVAFNRSTNFVAFDDDATLWLVSATLALPFSV